MRVTSSMYYNNLYGTKNLQLNKELFDVNKQIASGQKIQYAHDDVQVFTETMRLDNEITSLGQIKQSTNSGYKLSNQSDVVLNEFTGSMNRMRTLLLQSANGTNDSASLDAISSELVGIEKNLKNLANTSINGQYLFSGSATNIRPISDDGTYNGNDVALNAFLGSRNQQQYNISGQELFLGEEVLVNRELTTNVINANIMGGSSLSESSTIRDLMGDKDNNIATVHTSYFYLRGTKSDGTAIKQKIPMADTEKISGLLAKIGQAYGNTGTVDLVSVKITDNGQIAITDNKKGSSKLEFSLVGAVDYVGASANVNDIDLLDGGSTTYPPAGNLYIKEFMKSGYTSTTGAASNIEGLVYDRVAFVKKDSLLSSTVPQIVNKNNAFATASTKLSEVADLSLGTSGTLDGTTFKLVGLDTSGNAFNVDINLLSTANGGSTFTTGGNTYNIYNMDTPRAKADADTVTYQQLMDVMNMITTNTLPAGIPGTDTQYDKAITDSQYKGTTFLSHDGKIQFRDISTSLTQASVSLYDTNSDNFAADASVMTFNSNNAITVRDPKTDFFKTINEIITSVAEYKLAPDSSSGTARNAGISNAIAMMDDIQDHIFRSQAVVGSNSNTLTDSLERTEILEISTMTLRSQVLDTDLAESALRLQQLTLNYEAMLSTVGRVSQLSLVNYL